VRVAHLDRSGAVALLRELIASGLVMPSFVSIEKTPSGSFSLTIENNGNLVEIRAFLSEKTLILAENKEKGTCSIYEP
jgi:hypothetical protein